MIKFFRKIRQSLLTENKTSKYLLYAFGEIILVVMGILIALQINNSNNDRQLREIEQEYLISLQAEFRTNLKKLNDCIIRNEEHVQDVEDLLLLFDRSILDTISEKEMSDKIYNVMGKEVTYSPSNGVITDIISSGNLNLLLNKELRHQIASFESSIEKLKKQESGATFGKRNLQQLVIKNSSIRNVLMNRDFEFEHHSISETVDNRQLFNSVEFENGLLDYYLVSRFTNKSIFTDLKDEVEMILTEIDADLMQ